MGNKNTEGKKNRNKTQKITEENYLNVLPGAMIEVVKVPSWKQRWFLIFGCVFIFRRTTQMIAYFTWKCPWAVI